MKLKRLLLVLILVIAVSLFTLPAPLSADLDSFPLPPYPTDPTPQFTAVCSDNPSETRCWEVTNPNDFDIGFRYSIDNVNWVEESILSNDTLKICLPLVDPTVGIITGLKGEWHNPNWMGGYITIGTIATTNASCTGAPTKTTETQWVRPIPMTCWQVFINEDNIFEFIFWYPYKDNNWVRIYDMKGNMVYEVDVPLKDPHIVVDLSDGFYIVKIFHHDTLLQEFLIGKP